MTSPRREEVIKRLNKLLSDEETKKILDEIDAITTSFDKDVALIMTKHVKEVNSKIDAASINFAQDAKNDLTDLIVIEAADMFIDSLLFYGAESSVASHGKMSQFISIAARLWESSAVKFMQHSLTSGLVNSFIKNRPMPSKENLS